MKIRREVKDEVEVKRNYERYFVRDNNNTLLGSFYINSARVVWCEGRTQVDNGIAMTWNKFISHMKS